MRPPPSCIVPWNGVELTESQRLVREAVAERCAAFDRVYWRERDRTGEYDVDVIVTERGAVDLRGLSPVERADRVVEVAHPDYRADLRAYLERAGRRGGHVPHDLETALAWPRERRRDG